MPAFRCDLKLAPYKQKLNQEELCSSAILLAVGFLVLRKLDFVFSEQRNFFLLLNHHSY